ncbi:hypothetical protein [Hymenobacter guriensis]|uniref:Uncharacterized protein n=1 Tax=Hymenobacter guriensis TaxID=2793065 RepID=A0ABS0KZB6_9BACT|nr:hypothetical protein [Hymenobacter guriensis]MBG8552554.1 hypothetical protein [Hymenobacter guriensis]
MFVLLLPVASCTREEQVDPQKFYASKLPLFEDLVQWYKVNPIRRFQKEGDEVSVLIADAENVDLLYELYDREVDDPEVKKAFDHVGWSDAHVNTLLYKMGKVNCSLIALLPNSSGSAYDVELTCELSDGDTVVYKFFAHDLSPDSRRIIDTYTVKKGLGGIISNRVMWHTDTSP